jgi:hypothetical protein
MIKKIILIAILPSFNFMVKAEEYQGIKGNEPLNNPTNETQISVNGDENPEFFNNQKKTR